MDNIGAFLSIDTETYAELNMGVILTHTGAEHSLKKRMNRIQGKSDVPTTKNSNALLFCDHDRFTHRDAHENK